MKLTVRNAYTQKDQVKSDKANKFIGRGSLNSSTNQYRQDWMNKANISDYTIDDVVFVSAEGNRRGRVRPNFNEILCAIEGQVTFVLDNKYNRERSFNIGEREVASFLELHGYKCIEQPSYALWIPKEYKPLKD